MRWYDKGHRDLPWRRTRDPYRVWVSEIMCQQTRVDTVIPYYERFIASFPTPAALAEADEDAVMSHWSGLGYYRRARMLHAGAKDVVARYQGSVPSGAEDRLSLPGVGRYTAGAIGSIAFDREEAIVDGNVARVLSRVHRIPHALQSTASNKALWVHAEALVRGKRPGDLNQSIMELGALVCTPTSPKCSECPIAKGCEALQTGDVDSFPVPKKKKKPTRLRLVASVGTANGKVWLRRGDKKLFGGLWGVPMLPIEGTDETPARRAALAKSALRQAGIVGRAPKCVGEVEHVLSHRHMFVDVFQTKAARGETSDDLRAVAHAEMASIGIATLTRKILALI